MTTRPQGSDGASTQTPPDGFDAVDFGWPQLGPGEPPAPPSAPPPAPPHRRRIVAVAALLALFVGAVLLVDWLAGPSGGSGGGRTARDRAQLEAAAPGSSKQGSHASLAVAATVRRAADALPLPRGVAQLFAVSTDAHSADDPSVRRLRRRDWGTVVLPAETPVDEAGATRLTRAVRTGARAAKHLPPLVAADQAGGLSSAFPDLPPRAQPLAGDRGGPARARSDALRAARALRRMGIRMTLAPVADVGVAAGPVEDRVFGDNARQVTRLTAAAVAGYRRGRVIPAVGHFPGQGTASEDPDLANATVGLSVAELRARDLRPFAAVTRRAPVIMLSNAVYAGFDGVTPATTLPDAVELLRRELRYPGVVMSADLTSTAPVLGTGVGTAAVAALEAGVDVLYVHGGARRQEAAYRAVLRAVRRGRISRARLRLSVERVLALKRRYGVALAPRRASAAKRPRGRAPRSSTDSGR